MKRDHLLLIARVKLRLAGSILLIAGALSVWLMAERLPQEQIYCGLARAEVDTIIEQRWAHADSLRRAAFTARFGQTVDPENGVRLFKTNCAACHKPDRDMTGPALKGVLEHAPLPALNWVHAFVTREDSLIDAKEPHTLAIRKAWGENPWRHRERSLSLNDVADIMVWVEFYGSKPVH